MTLPKLYTVDDVAEYVGCSPSTIYAAITRGQLRACTVGAKQTKRITETAILEWLGEPTEVDPAVAS